MIPEINLLPQRDARQRTNRLVLLGGLTLWILLLALIIVQYFLAKQDLEFAEHRLEQMEQEKVVLEERLAKMAEEERTITLQEAVDFVERLTLPTSVIIEELLELLPEQSHLTYYSFSSGAVDIEVEFESLNRVAEYVANLDHSELFNDVKVDVISTQQLEEMESREGDNSVIFSILPRYSVDFSLQVNMRELAVRGDGDE